VPSSYITGLKCVACGHEQSDLSKTMRCDSCGGYCQATYDLDGLRRGIDRHTIRSRSGGIWRFRELLPVRHDENIITLAEGGTPLLRSRNLGPRLGLKNLYFKDLTRNPTYSFKDYSSSTSVSKAKEIGISEIVLMSAGNASSSFAAYCAVAGIPFHAFMVSNTFEGMIVQNTVYGPHAKIVDGNTEEAGKIASRLATEHGWMNGGVPTNPYRVEGKKVIGFEIAEALNWQTPDRIVCPTAGGTSIMALYKGFNELKALGWVDRLPKLDCIQAETCSPVVEAWQTGGDLRPAKSPDSIAVGLLAPNPEAGPLLVSILRETGGIGETVSDPEIREAQLMLAREEGLFVEPSSAASLAGLIKALCRGAVDGEERIVLMLTGSGLKSPEAIAPLLSKPQRIEAAIS
jgi:threonine synthase